MGFQFSSISEDMVTQFLLPKMTSLWTKFPSACKEILSGAPARAGPFWGVLWDVTKDPGKSLWTQPGLIVLESSEEWRICWESARVAALEKVAYREPKLILVKVLLCWLKALLQNSLFQSSSTMKLWAASAVPFPGHGTMWSWQSGVSHGSPASFVPFSHFLDPLWLPFCSHSPEQQFGQVSVLFSRSSSTPHTVPRSYSASVVKRKRRNLKWPSCRLRWRKSRAWEKRESKIMV